MKIRDGLWALSIPFQVALGGLAMGAVTGVALCLLPIALVTMPVWLPIRWYFTTIWNANERSKRAIADLETHNLLEQFDDPNLRRSGQWWRES